MSTARVIARNIFSNWANLAVSVALGFFTLPLMVHRLGDSLYGIWTLVVSLVGYGNLLDFGVRSSIVKYVSQYHAADDKVRMQSLYATTLALYCGIAAFVVVLAALGAVLMPHLFAIQPDMVADARLVLLIVGINVALKFPGGVFEGFITGLQRYEIANAISIGANLFRTALIVAALLSGEKLVALATIGLGCEVLTMTAMMVACRRHLPWLALRRRSLDPGVLRSIYSYGLWSAVIAVATRVLYDSDSILIGVFLPALAITHFAVANSLVRYLRQLALGFGNVFSPAASGLEASSEQERLGVLVTHGTRYALAVVLPAAVLLALLGRDFLSLWMGPRFATESATALIILVLSQAIAMAQFPAGAVLYGLNRHRFLALVLLAEAFIKVAITAATLPSLGILGAAWGTAIPELLASIVFVPLLVTRFVRLPLATYFRRAFAPAILSVLPAAAAVTVAKAALGPASWTSLTIEVGLGLVVYAAAAFRFCIDQPQRAAFAAVVARVTRLRALTQQR